MVDGLTFPEHNEIIFQVIAILEETQTSPETRIQQALTYCHGHGIYWPTVALEACVTHFHPQTQE